MTNNEPAKVDREYVSESGRRLKWRQMAYSAWKEGAEVEPTDDGALIFRGERFEPVTEGDDGE